MAGLKTCVKNNLKIWICKSNNYKLQIKIGYKRKVYKTAGAMRGMLKSI